MVHTRSGLASPAVSRVRGAPPSPQRPPLAPAEDTPLMPAERPTAAGSHLRRAGFVALFCYLAWFVLILGGILAYEGEPILVKSHDLPLHWFDKLFRTLGSALLFALWAVRAGAARLLRWDKQAALVFVPAAIYGVQALIRLVIYQLHVAGYIFTPQRYARDNLSHPPHVMSDHILLASAVHGGLASEALLPLLNWCHAGVPGRAFLRAYSAAAGVLALLVSAECYFTARYFHPPGETILAAGLGLAAFQAPLLCQQQATMAALSVSSRHQPPTSFASLPDDLLLRVLAVVPLADRHASCCLVSKHWYGLVHSPQLLHSLEVTLCEARGQPVRRLRSLAVLVHHHAGTGQLNALRLNHQLPVAGWIPEGEAEADALTGGMLARCNALTGLQLSVNWGVMAGSWLAGMPSLRLLTIQTRGNVHITLPRQQMPPLGELHLESEKNAIVFQPWAGLPPSLSKLCLSGSMHSGLPAEMSTLIELRSLHLESISYAAARSGLTFLPLLRRLEQLHLRGCWPLPRCVSQLTQLRALSLADKNDRFWQRGQHPEGAEQTAAAVRAAVAQLTRLTFLAISDMPGMTAPPPAITALTELRTLYWAGVTDENGESVAPPFAALPGGAWLSGLQTLAAPPNVLLSTAPALGTAAQLHCIGILKSYAVSLEHVAAAIRWAVGCPGLRRLLVEPPEPAIQELCSQAGAAQQLPAGLRIESVEQQHICRVLIEECKATI
ncbi:Leucine-rich repeat-containing 1 [Chlorella sorokiniana]|uniref:Leucine-rich repeat-containing 1 n=1 Tax=Chlorella sorokiniana TaxID=3076 RepID=A0A2P6TK89_CHLSO|nr:Leucine-rich repeat-containing 1 [Chlorella sorokiniana]|eukprot:PRW44503.1 Leucine-rich repeat-containing 1 [Chlorella sorokiniana]